jgi:translation elongation factor EF-4
LIWILTIQISAKEGIGITELFKSLIEDIPAYEF